MSYLKNLKWEMIIYSILAIVIGILMCKNPTGTLNAICIVLAIMLFVMGLRYLLEYRSKNLINDFYKYELVIGVILITLGIVVLTCMDLILSIITYVIALIIIISGIMKVENALDLRKMGDKWMPLMVIAGVCIVLGISVLMMPMNHNDDGSKTAGDFFIQCAGVIFAITGTIDLITTLSVSAKIREWIDTQK